ncbi:MAG: hypothetical protein ABIC40_05240 [bacterium]
MAEIHEFREARLKFGTDSVSFAVEARIEEKWETLSFPVSLEGETVRNLPTLKHITAFVRRKYHEDSPLHAALDGSAVTLEFYSGGETVEFGEVRVLEWKVFGEAGGELIEEVSLSCESET